MLVREEAMRVLYCITLGVALLISGTAWAQAPAYPAKPVRILVGFGAGGGIDIVARLLAQRLTDSLGQSFIVENRPGAAGSIATDLVAKAPPDGYTVLMASVTHAINATLYSKLPYDSLRDFAPVSPVAQQANGISVHPSVPAKSLRDLLALAKAQPGQLSYAHAGNGTMMHVGMELFRSMAGIQMLPVPYNGSGPSTLAVLGGQVPVLSSSLPPALPHARAGKLRMLAVSTAQRTPLAPEFPTIAEAAGLKGYEAVLWIGMLAPAATPPAVVNRLNTEIGRLLQTPDMRNQLTAQFSDPYHETPAGFAQVIKSDIAKWGKIIRESGARAD
jgi:tripartite-type tricarboxylate transporter receptor subunit TctC